MRHDELVVLRTFNNHVQADLARGALQAAGIEAMVRADDAGGQEVGLWTGNGVQVLVRAEDAAVAADVLNASASGT